MFLVIHKTVNFVVLSEIVAFLTKKNSKTQSKSFYLASSFFNLKQPSSLPLLLQKLLKHEKKDPEVAKIVNIIINLSPDEALF